MTCRAGVVLLGLTLGSHSLSLSLSLSLPLSLSLSGVEPVSGLEQETAFPLTVTHHQ